MRIIAGSKRGMKLFSPKTDASRPITDRVKESLFSVLYKYDLPAVRQAHRPERSRRSGKIAADLFCGVGSLGLEALSRGAEFVTFVEKDPKIIATLKKNIEKAGFAGPATARSLARPTALPWRAAVTSESPLGDTLLRSGTLYGGWKAGHGTSRTRARVIRADAFKIGAPVDEQKYDLVFVDPPYSTTRETKEGSPLSELLVLLNEQSAVGGIVVVRTERRTELLEQYGRFEVIERRQWGTMAVTILQRPATARP